MTVWFVTWLPSHRDRLSGRARGRTKIERQFNRDGTIWTRRFLIRVELILYKLITAYHLVSGLELSKLASKRDRKEEKRYLNFIRNESSLQIYSLRVCLYRRRIPWKHVVRIVDCHERCVELENNSRLAARQLSEIYYFFYI